MTSTTTKRLTLFLPVGLIKQAKAQAVLENISLTALVHQALIAHLPTETIIKKIDTGVMRNPVAERSDE